MHHRKADVKYLRVLVIGGAVLLSGALSSWKSLAQYEGERRTQERGNVQTLEGVISDSMCGAKHSGPDAATCTQSCVNNGKGWVLVVGDKVYSLEGRMSGISYLAGKPAKVTGRVTGNKIVVSSVDAPS